MSEMTRSVPTTSHKSYLASRVGIAAIISVLVATAVTHLFAAGNRPLWGSFETTFTLSPTPVVVDPELGVLLKSHVDGTGSFMRARECRVTIDQAVTLDASLKGTLAGVMVITCSGGTIKAYEAGVTGPAGPGVAFEGTMTFWGGTGRFARTTGMARFSGSASLADGTGQFSVMPTE